MAAVWGRPPSGCPAKPRLGTDMPWRHRGDGTHLLQWGPGADKVKDELVGVLLHPGGNVSIHLGEGREVTGSVSARAGGQHGGRVGGWRGGSLAVLTMTLRSL